MVIIDYLQLISSPPESRGARLNEVLRIAEISRSLKLLAKDHNIPVVVMSQLNREVEHRQSGRPQLSDLRDSGAIEQDADIVMFLNRKVVPQEDGGGISKETELKIAKNRNGPSDIIIPLWFEGEYTLFYEYDPDPPPAGYRPF
jgi:replicative DNA helicase